MTLSVIFSGSVSRSLLFFFGVIFLCTYNASPSCAQTITLGTGEWCPYVCDPKINNGLKGYLADIAEIVFQKAGYETKFRVLPLGRTIMMCHKGTINGVMSIFREDAPDLMFPKAEQGITTSIFLTKKGNPWKYTGMESLNQISKMGLVQDYNYPLLDPFIKAHPEKITSVKEDNALQKRLKMMLKGRIDVLVEDRFVIQYVLKRMNMTALFTEAGEIEKNPVYIPFSPVIPESEKYAEILVKGVEELRKSGELDKIMDTYGLQDWKK